MSPEFWFPNLGIYFERVPQYLITIGDFSIYLYAVCIVTGIMSAYFLAVWWAKKTGQDPNVYTDLLLLGVVLAFIGLRLYYMIFNWDSFRGQSFIAAFLDIRRGGLAIYGGIMGALLAGVIMSRRKKIPFSTFADTCAPSLLLGQIIGRFGNFFNAEAFGGHSDGLFALRIRLDRVRMPSHMLPESFVINGHEYIQVHPTFFYESFFNLLLMIALIIYRPYKKFAGEMLLLYMLGYGIIRFFIEGLRVDQLMFFGTNFPASQIVSVLFVIIAIVLLVKGYMYKEPEKRKKRGK